MTAAARPHPKGWIDWLERNSLRAAAARGFESAAARLPGLKANRDEMPPWLATLCRTSHFRADLLPLTRFNQPRGGLSMTRSRRNTGLWAGFRQRQDGLTMPEIMLGLSLIAVVSIGAITAYNQVAPRVAGNNLLSGMNAFLVDAAQYTGQFHTDQPSGQPEASVSGNAGNLKDWGGTAVVDTITITCTAANVPHPDCTAAGVPAAWAVPNPNVLRLVNMPSLRHGDGAYDQDPVAEWHIPISDNVAIEVAFEVIPDNGLSAQGVGIWGVCPINDNPTLPDTALVVQAALDNKATCDYVAQAIERMDHISNAWCLDNETNPVAPALGANTNGDVALNMCFSVMR